MLGGIVGALVGGRDQGMRGACIAEPAPVLLQHDWERGLDAVERREQADCYDGVPLVFKEGVHWGHVLDITTSFTRMSSLPSSSWVLCITSLRTSRAVLRHKQKHRTQWASRGRSV